MMAIPFSIDNDRYSIFIILEQENIDRIKEYDPAEIQAAKLGEGWSKKRLKDIIISYATSEEIKKILELSAKGDGLAVLRLVSRGFKYRPELGDNDSPYRKIT